MRRPFFIVILFIPFIAFSEIPDPVLLPKDSVAAKKISAEFRKERIQKTITYIPPILFAGYGFMALNNKALLKVDHSVYSDMAEDHPGFSTSADNYLQYAPAALAGVLDISGIKGRHSFFDQAALYAVATGFVTVSVTFFKRSADRFRPNQSAHNSFPSGHTSTAFAAAEFLNQEYADRSIWYGIAGYSAAAATGILRVYNNAHWFSDVVAGAGFGILSAKASYLVYPYLKKLINPARNNFKVLPTWQKGYPGISIHGDF